MRSIKIVFKKEEEVRFASKYDDVADFNINDGFLNILNIRGEWYCINLDYIKIYIVTKQ